MQFNMPDKMQYKVSIRENVWFMPISPSSSHIFPTYYDPTTLMGLLVLEHEMVRPTSESGHVQFLESKIFSKLFNK